MMSNKTKPPRAIQINQYHHWFLVGLIVFSFFVQLIAPNSAKAVPSGFSANYQDTTNITMSGGGFNNAVVSKGGSGTSFINRNAIFEGNPNDPVNCEISIEISPNDGEPGRGTIKLLGGNALGGNICDENDVDDFGWSFGDEATITIGNTGVFDDSPSNIGRSVSVCSHVNITRDIPSAMVSEITPETTDTITIEQPPGTVIRTKQARLSNGDSREDEVAKYCATFKLAAGDYVARSALGEATKSFEKINGQDRSVTIIGENEPISNFPDDDAAPDGPQTCDENFKFTGGFLVCIILGIIDTTVDNMVDAIADMLSVGRAEINDDGLKTAWSYFRNIASVLLVVIGLVMIIGQAVSKE